MGDNDDGVMEHRTDWMEQQSFGGFRRWHLIFMTAAALQSIISVLCCCFRIRIPRTKMQIDADYRRRQLAEKFRKKLKIVQNADMDDLDLQTALERIRAEFRSDSISLAQSEAIQSLPDDDDDFFGSRSHVQDIGFSLEELQQDRARGFVGRAIDSVSGVFARVANWVLVHVRRGN